MGKKYFRLVEGASRPRSEAEALTFPDGGDIRDFRKAVFKECERSIPQGIRPPALKVFKSSEEKEPLGGKELLSNYGESEEDPLIVEIPMVWFQLAEADSHTPFKGTSADSVPLTENSTIEDLQNAVKTKYNDSLLAGIAASALKVYDDTNQGPLGVDTRIKSLGQTLKTALIVAVTVPARTRQRGESKEEAAENPAKRHKADAPTQWEWREEERVYCVDRGILFFVNREHATEQLLELHKNNYNRARFDDGDNWVIPLVDNMSGLGKSIFGQEYIRRCQCIWEGLAADKKVEGSFMDTMRQCHTITIELSPDGLLRSTDLTVDTKVLDTEMAAEHFFQRIGSYIEDNQGRIPRALAPNLHKPNPNCVEVMENLTDEVGPLFIVIDEIGKAFAVRSLDYFGQRELFVEFCNQILSPFFSIRNVFFLIAGRAPFLGCVGLNVRLPASSFDFQRLSLNLLRPPAIEKIIKKTYWDKQKTETIQQHYELDDCKVTMVAANLFRSTFGHPRSMLRAFKVCQSYDELIAFPPPNDGIDWENLGTRVWHYKNPLHEMMESVLKAEAIDLSLMWIGDGNKSVAYNVITYMFGITWEGEVKNAKLYMPTYVQRAILASYQFKTLLGNVAPTLSKVAIDHPDEFELLCVTRFQEMFHEENCPSTVLPNFFTTTQKFGSCIGVKFAKESYYMPKITVARTTPASLASATAKRDDLGNLLGRIDEFVRDKSGQLVLKPLARSSSPAILLFSTVQDTKVLVGLAVKNYNGTDIDATTIQKECEKFSGICKQLSMSRNKRLNVLIMCATSYTGQLSEQFGESKSAVYPIADLAEEAREGVDEVILLDLCTAAKRAEFFGIVNEDNLKAALEEVISKRPVDGVGFANE